MTVHAELVRLADGAALAEHVVQKCGKGVPGSLSVGLAVDRSRAYATWQGGSAGTGGAAQDAIEVPAACIVKVFTAAMLVQEIEEQGIGSDCRVSSILGPSAEGAAVLDGISLRQLLDHTHGLDGSHIATLPLRSDGYIDSAELCAAVARVPTLHGPGELYNYGSLGCWLAAAVLERTAGRKYAELLSERVLAPADIRARSPQGGVPTVCPATGGDLLVSARDVLAFLDMHVRSRSRPGRDGAGCPMEVMPGAPVPMPGWCFEQGSCVGWRYYGAGWYGYNAVVSHASARIRVHFEDRVGIAVLADDVGAGLALARLFGKVLPEFKVQPLQPLRDGDDASAAFGECVGEYRSQALSANIHLQDSMPTLSIEDRSQGHAKLFETPLTPFLHNIFVPESAAKRLFPIVQFIRTGSGAAGSTHLWNGSQVLRRA